jgi:hypothetical protein
MLITPNLSLPYIDVNEAQREVVHNEAIRGLDALVQLAVLDRDLTSPPGSPADGERWIVAASPSGAWASHAGEIAAWQDGAWRFYAPQVGWFVYVVDEGALLAWNGSAWIDALAMAMALQNLSLLGIGTTADATNPFSAKLNNALWIGKTVAEGGDGDLRYKLSKESAAKTLSLLMQTNFSGRAEIGLIGDDDFRFKVSPDGSTWYESFVISRSSGKLLLGIDGSAAAPALAWAADPDNGIYRTGANAWSLACAGAQAIGIASTSISIPLATASTSVTTGALAVAGGVGIGKGVCIGETISARGDPSAFATIDAQNATLVVANGANQLLFGGSTPNALIFISDDNYNGMVLFLAGSMHHMTSEGTAFETSSTTSPAAGKTSFGYDGGWRIYNNTGASRTYAMFIARTK